MKRHITCPMFRYHTGTDTGTNIQVYEEGITLAVDQTIWKESGLSIIQCTLTTIKLLLGDPKFLNEYERMVGNKTWDKMVEILNNPEVQQISGFSRTEHNILTLALLETLYPGALSRISEHKVLGCPDSN